MTHETTPAADGLRPITATDLQLAGPPRGAPPPSSPPRPSAPSPISRRSGSTCPQCAGEGLYLTTPAAAAAARLIVTATYGEDRALVVCSACAAGSARAQTWRGVPADAVGVRLDNGTMRQINDPDHRRALEAVVAMIRDPRGWLTLAGGYGTGKTQLLYAALNHLAERGVYGRYTTAPDLLDFLRDGISSGDSPGSRLRGLAESPVLAVDELDKFNATAFAEEQLFKLFHARYQAREERATLIGYNLDGADRIPPFLRSRIRDGRFLCVELRGPDLRPTLSRSSAWDRGADDGPKRRKEAS